MASLEQVEYSFIEPSAGIVLAEFVVAFHRRSSTFLTYSKVLKSFQIVRHDEHDSKRYYPVARWDVPLKVAQILAVHPVESFSLFCFVGINIDGCTMVMFIDLSGKLVFEFNLPRAVKPMSTEMDQHRHELIVGLTSGELQCYYINTAKVHTEALETKLGQVTKSTLRDFQISMRKNCHVSFGKGRRPLQLMSMDKAGFLLVLSDSGSITCVETNKFTVLFSIPVEMFLIRPSRVWGDKFGSSFVVHCKNVHNGKESVEYWTLPVDFSSCELGEFGRLTIPYNGKLLGLSIESVGTPYASCFIALITSDRKLQLWRPQNSSAEDGDDEGVVVLSECKINLTLPGELFDVLGQLVMSDLHQPHDFLADSVLSNLTQHLGIFSFNRESFNQPGCALTFIASFCKTICKLAVHLPSSLDVLYQQAYSHIALHQLMQAQNSTAMRRSRGGMAARGGENGDVPDDISLSSEASGSVDITKIPINKLLPASFFGHGGQNKANNTSANKNKSFGIPVPRNSSSSQRVKTGERQKKPQALVDDEERQELAIQAGSSAGASATNSDTPNDGARSNNGGRYHQNRSSNSSLIKKVVNFSESKDFTLGSGVIDESININDSDNNNNSSSNNNNNNNNKNETSAPNTGRLSVKSEDDDQSKLSEGIMDILRDMEEFDQEVTAAGRSRLLKEEKQIGGGHIDNHDEDDYIETHSVLENASRASRANSFSAASSHRSLHSSIAEQLGSAHTVHFTPLVMMYKGTARHTYDPDGLFQLVEPSNLLVRSHAQFDEMAGISLFTRRGLLELQDERSMENLEFKLSSIAYRTGRMAVFTVFKEGYIFDLSSSIQIPPPPRGHTPPKPFRVEMTVANATSILHSDVSIRVPGRGRGAGRSSSGGSSSNTSGSSKRDSSKNSAAPLPPDYIEGMFTLLLIGDSDGKISFAVNRSDAVLSFGSIPKAHTSPVVSLLVTGDPVQPLWKIACEQGEDSGSVIPGPAAGSAMISMASDGEVKVWQPFFVQTSSGRSSAVDKLFIVYSLQWRLSGFFSVGAVSPLALTIRRTASGGISSSEQESTTAKDNQRLAKTVQCACIDPTCMNVVIGFKNGSVEQWAIPGLLDNDDGSLGATNGGGGGGGHSSSGAGLATVQEALWCSDSEHHVDSVVSLNVWVHAACTSVAELDVSRNNLDREEMINNLGTYIPGQNKFTVGYTAKTLHAMSQASSLVSCSRDMSLVLWGWEVKKMARMSDGAATHSASSTALVPIPCKRFTFSEAPHCGLCFSIKAPAAGSGSSWAVVPLGQKNHPQYTPNDMSYTKNVWRITALVNGCVVTVFEDIRSCLFAKDQQNGDPFELAAKLRSAARDFGEGEGEGDGGKGSLTSRSYASASVQSNALLARSSASSIVFDDEVEDYANEACVAGCLYRSKTSKQRPSANVALSTIPVICEVHHPAVIVETIAINKKDAKKGIRSWQKLEDWAMIDYMGAQDQLVMLDIDKSRRSAASQVKDLTVVSTEAALYDSYGEEEGEEKGEKEKKEESNQIGPYSKRVGSPSAVRALDELVYSPARPLSAAAVTYNPAAIEEQGLHVTAHPVNLPKDAKPIRGVPATTDEQLTKLYKDHDGKVRFEYHGIRQVAHEDQLLGTIRALDAVEGRRFILDKSGARPNSTTATYMQTVGVQAPLVGTTVQSPPPFATAGAGAGSGSGVVGSPTSLQPFQHYNEETAAGVGGWGGEGGGMATSHANVTITHTQLGGRESSFSNAASNEASRKDTPVVATVPTGPNAFNDSLVDLSSFSVPIGGGSKVLPTGPNAPEFGIVNAPSITGGAKPIVGTPLSTAKSKTVTSAGPQAPSSTDKVHRMMMADDNSSVASSQSAGSAGNHYLIAAMHVAPNMGGGSSSSSSSSAAAGGGGGGGGDVDDLHYSHRSMLSSGSVPGHSTPVMMVQSPALIASAPPSAATKNNASAAAAVAAGGEGGEENRVSPTHSLHSRRSMSPQPKFQDDSIDNDDDKSTHSAQSKGSGVISVKSVTYSSKNSKNVKTIDLQNDLNEHFPNFEHQPKESSPISKTVSGAGAGPGPVSPSNSAAAAAAAAAVTDTKKSPSLVDSVEFESLTESMNLEDDEDPADMICNGGVSTRINKALELRHKVQREAKLRLELMARQREKKIVYTSQTNLDAKHHDTEKELGVNQTAGRLSQRGQQGQGLTHKGKYVVNIAPGKPAQVHHASALQSRAATTAANAAAMAARAGAAATTGASADGSGGSAVTGSESPRPSTGVVRHVGGSPNRPGSEGGGETVHQRQQRFMWEESEEGKQYQAGGTGAVITTGDGPTDGAGIVTDTGSIGRYSLDNSLDNINNYRVSSPPLHAVSPMPSHLSTEMELIRQRISGSNPSAPAAGLTGTTSAPINDDDDDVTSTKNGAGAASVSSSVPTTLHRVPSPVSSVVGRDHESATKNLRLDKLKREDTAFDDASGLSTPNSQRPDDGNSDTEKLPGTEFSDKVELVKKKVRGGDGKKEASPSKPTAENVSGDPRKGLFKNADGERMSEAEIKMSRQKSFIFEAPPDLKFIDRKAKNKEMLASQFKDRGLEAPDVIDGRPTLKLSPPAPPGQSLGTNNATAAAAASSLDAADGLKPLPGGGVADVEIGPDAGFYFDRNAAPIFKERKKISKHKLVQRTTRVEAKKDYEKRMEKERKENEAALQKYAAEFDPTAGMTETEKAAFLSLDGAAQARIIKALKEGKGIDKSELARAPGMQAGASISDSGSTQQTFVKTAAVARNRLDIVELVVTAERLTVQVTSPAGGTVFVALTSPSSGGGGASASGGGGVALLSPPRSPIKAWSAEQINGKSVPGLLQCRKVTCLPQSEPSFVMFENLRPLTKYVVYVIAESSTDELSEAMSKGPLPLDDEGEDDESVAEHPFIDITTPDETPYVDWISMTAKQQEVEVKAALRSKMVQDLAAASEPPIHLPTDDEIRLRAVFRGSDVYESGGGGRKVDPNDDGTQQSNANSRTPSRQAAAAAAGAPPTSRGGRRPPSTPSGGGGGGSGGGGGGKDTPRWLNFLEWWSGSRALVVPGQPITVPSHPYTAPRYLFLQRELLFAAQNKLMLARYSEEGFADTDEAEGIATYVKGALPEFERKLASGAAMRIFNAANNQAITPSTDSVDPEKAAVDAVAAAMLKANQETVEEPTFFQQFRSWYRGGKVYLEKKDAEEMKVLLLASANVDGGGGDEGDGLGMAVGSSSQIMTLPQSPKASRPASSQGTAAAAASAATTSKNGSKHPTPGPSAANSRPGSKASSRPGTSGGDHSGDLKISLPGSANVSRPGTAAGTAQKPLTTTGKDPFDETREINGQLDARAQFLRTRIAEVDKCAEQVQALIDAHRFGALKKLKIEDMETKRSQLSARDIVAIMSTQKLNALCISVGLVKAATGISFLDGDVFGRPPFTLNAISGCDLFKVVNPDNLQPDQPPAVGLACLPGTERHPIKPWQMCTEPEKLLEAALACSLDAIVELAVMDGIEVPDPEDLNLNSDFFPLQAKRLQEFIKWYAGDEMVQLAAGKGIPTLARVVFAEDWETRAVSEDPFLAQSMIKNGFAVPRTHRPDLVKKIEDARLELENMDTVTIVEPSILLSAGGSLVGGQGVSSGGPIMFNDSVELASLPGSTAGGAGGAGAASGASVVSASAKSTLSQGTKGMTREAKELAKIKEQQAQQEVEKAESEARKAREKEKALAEAQIEEMENELAMGDSVSSIKHAYTNALNTVAGMSIRINLIGRHLNSIMVCRRMTVQRAVWMPGAASTQESFIFPRMGLITPKFELPPPRIRPFPSRSVEAYTHQELAELWYTSDELDEEDRLMQEAEKYGQKMRAYNEWMSKHEDRVEECRNSMEVEDRVARIIRATNYLVEENVNKYIAKLELHAEDESSDDEDDDHYSASIGSVSYANNHQGRDEPRALERSASNDSNDSNDSFQDPGAPPPLLTSPEIKMKRQMSMMKRQASIKISSKDVKDDSDEEKAVKEPTVPEKKFMFLHNLPKDYWYIFEESVEFRFGSGVHNDDELDDIRREQQDIAQRAVEAATKFENYLQEEKRRREKEEAERVRKEEQDRRMSDNLERRRKLREMFEELKRERVQDAEDARMALIQEEQDRIEEEIRADEERRERQEILDVKLRMEEEQRLMSAEETHSREIRLRGTEITLMAHEDINSFVREQYEAQVEIDNIVRAEELRALYIPFEPFQFKKTRNKLPRLHQVLKDEEEFYYENDFDSSTIAGDNVSVGGSTVRSSTSYSPDGSTVGGMSRGGGSGGSGGGGGSGRAANSRAFSGVVSPALSHMNSFPGTAASSAGGNDSPQLSRSSVLQNLVEHTTAVNSSHSNLNRNTKSSFVKRSDRYKLLYESTRKSTVQTNEALQEEKRFIESAQARAAAAAEEMSPSKNRFDDDAFVLSPFGGHGYNKPKQHMVNTNQSFEDHFPSSPVSHMGASGPPAVIARVSSPSAAAAAAATTTKTAGARSSSSLPPSTVVLQKHPFSANATVHTAGAEEEEEEEEEVMNTNPPAPTADLILDDPVGHTVSHVSCVESLQQPDDIRKVLGKLKPVPKDRRKPPQVRKNSYDLTWTFGSTADGTQQQQQGEIGGADFFKLAPRSTPSTANDPHKRAASFSANTTTAAATSKPSSAAAASSSASFNNMSGVASRVASAAANAVNNVEKFSRTVSAGSMLANNREGTASARMTQRLAPLVADEQQQQQHTLSVAELDAAPVLPPSELLWQRLDSAESIESNGLFGEAQEEEEKYRDDEAANKQIEEDYGNDGVGDEKDLRRQQMSAAALARANAILLEAERVEDSNIRMSSTIPTHAHVAAATSSASAAKPAFVSSPSTSAFFKAQGTNRSGKKGKVMVVSNSADLINSISHGKAAKEYQNLLQGQKSAAFASMTAIAHIDSHGLPQRKKPVKLASSAAADASTAPAPAAMSSSKKQQRRRQQQQQHDVLGAEDSDGAASRALKEKAMAKLKKELHDLGIVEENVIDFKTRETAKKADEAAARLTKEREVMEQYLSSGAVMSSNNDPFYLMACEPGLRDKSSIEAAFDRVRRGGGSPDLKKFLTHSIDLSRPPEMLYNNNSQESFLMANSEGNRDYSTFLDSSAAAFGAGGGAVGGVIMNDSIEGSSSHMLSGNAVEGGAVAGAASDFLTMPSTGDGQSQSQPQQSVVSAESAHNKSTTSSKSEVMLSPTMEQQREMQHQVASLPRLMRKINTAPLQPKQFIPPSNAAGAGVNVAPGDIGGASSLPSIGVPPKQFIHAQHNTHHRSGVLSTGTVPVQAPSVQGREPGLSGPSSTAIFGLKGANMGIKESGYQGTLSKTGPRAVPVSERQFPGGRHLYGAAKKPNKGGGGSKTGVVSKIRSELLQQQAIDQELQAMALQQLQQYPRLSPPTTDPLVHPFRSASPSPERSPGGADFSLSSPNFRSMSFHHKLTNEETEDYLAANTMRPTSGGAAAAAGGRSRGSSSRGGGSRGGSRQLSRAGTSGSSFNLGGEDFNTSSSRDLNALSGISGPLLGSGASAIDESAEAAAEAADIQAADATLTGTAAAASEYLLPTDGSTTTAHSTGTSKGGSVSLANVVVPSPVTSLVMADDDQ